MTLTTGNLAEHTLHWVCVSNYNEVFPWLHYREYWLNRIIYDALQILSDSQKRAHYEMYLLSQKKHMQRYFGQGSKLQIYKSQATAFKEMEVAEWLKWYRLTINNVLTENKMVVGSDYFLMYLREIFIHLFLEHTMVLKFSPWSFFLM